MVLGASPVKVSTLLSAYDGLLRKLLQAHPVNSSIEICHQL